MNVGLRKKYTFKELKILEREPLRYWKGHFYKTFPDVGRGDLG